MSPKIQEHSKLLGWTAFLINRYAWSGILKRNPAGGKIVATVIENARGLEGEALLDYLRNLDADSSKAMDHFMKKSGQAQKAVQRVIKIAENFRKRVFVFNTDYAKLPIPSHSTIYADPPYMEQGERMYRVANFDHGRLADWLKGQKVPWVLSYDDHPKVWKLYGEQHRIKRVPASYCINPGQRKSKKFEVLVFSR